MDLYMHLIKPQINDDQMEMSKNRDSRRPGNNKTELGPRMRPNTVLVCTEER